jgi:hypothetical protein
MLVRMWEYKLVQLLQKSTWRFLPKLKAELSIAWALVLCFRQTDTLKAQKRGKEWNEKQNFSSRNYVIMCGSYIFIFVRLHFLPLPP